MLHFLKKTTFLWITLILHPGHTILFLETVIIKFGGPRAEKNKYPLELELALAIILKVSG